MLDYVADVFWIEEQRPFSKSQNLKCMQQVVIVIVFEPFILMKEQLQRKTPKEVEPKRAFEVDPCELGHFPNDIVVNVNNLNKKV